jgi:hypothetical protein
MTKSDVGKIEVDLKLNLEQPILSKVRLEIGLFFMRLGTYIINGEL